MDPCAFFVPPDCDVVLWDQHLGGTVTECWECGQVGVVLLLVFVVVGDFPNTDFVVLVSAEKGVGLNY